MSWRLPRKSLLTRPTVLKSLSGDAKSWQAQPGTAWPCGPSVGTLAGASSTTWEGLCRWKPAALACMHLVRSPRWQRTGWHPFMCYWETWGHKKKNVRFRDLSIRKIHFSLSMLHIQTFQLHWKKFVTIVFPGWGEVFVLLTSKRASKTLGLGTCPSARFTSPWVCSI
jgi:hypothetical protein